MDDAGNEETVNAVVDDAGNEETVDAVVDDAADVDVTVDVDLVCVTITREINVQRH